MDRDPRGTRKINNDIPGSFLDVADPKKEPGFSSRPAAKASHDKESAYSEEWDFDDDA